MRLNSPQQENKAYNAGALSSCRNIYLDIFCCTVTDVPPPLLTADCCNGSLQQVRHPACCPGLTGVLCH